jgi:hypothetical protein
MAIQAKIGRKNVAELHSYSVYNFECIIDNRKLIIHVAIKVIELWHPWATCYPEAAKKTEAGHIQGILGN